MTTPILAKEARTNRKSSIEKGRLVRVSVSQIKSFNDCDLKWWLDKRAKLPRKPPSKGQITGDQCHKRIEHFLLTGDDVRGPLERSGASMLEPYVRFAPFNGGPLTVEAELTKPTIFTPGGVEFVGYSDLILPPGYMHAGPVIVDHKFKKDLEAYAEREHELREDVQAIVYAAWCLERWPDAKSVLFAHHNHQTQGPRLAYPVQVELDRDFVLDRFVSICSLVDGPMQTAASRITSEEVRFAHEGTCSKFGGCDFLTSCPNAPARRFAHTLIPGVPRPAITAKDDPPMGLVDAVRKQMNSAAAPASTAAVNPAPAAAAPPPAASTVAPPPAPAAPAPAGGLTRVIVANASAGGLYLLPSGGGLARLEVVSPSGAFFSKPDGSPVRAGLTDEVIDVSNDDVSRSKFGLAPLTSPAEPPAAAPAPAEKPARRMLIVDVPGDKPAEPGAGSAVAPPDQPPPARNPEELAAMTTAAPPPAAVSSEPPPPTAPADAPKKRGRPPGSGKKVGTMATAESVATGEASLPTGLVLCVDCAPNAGAQDLTAYVADLASTVAASASVPDVRFAPKDNPLAFMAWRGALAAAARESPPSGLCAIYSSDLAEPVIEALSGLASLVIRGRR